MSAQTADMIAGRSAQASPNPTSQPASPAAQQPPAKKSRKKGPSKPADSAADFRRKEANRLAAERSRMRAAEKAQAIKKAVEEAQEEQAQLEERIRELEEEKRRREAGAEVRREVEAAIAASEAEIAHGAEQGGETGQRAMGGDGHGDGGEVDADAHSRSILAALMSGNIPGLQEYADQVDDLGTQGGAQHVANGEVEVQGQAGQPSTSNWPDTPVETPSIGGQVESNTAGYPSSERASAINTVSNTAQTDTSVDYGSHPPSPLLQQHHAPSNQDSTNTTPAVQPRPAPTSTRTTLPPLHSDNILSTAHTSYIYSPQSALTAVCSSVAVLLNAEMEKTLRDDVAASREAIAGLEKEIERLEMAVREAEERGRAAAGGDGGEAVGGDGEAPQPERHSELAPPPNPLPAQTFHPVPILRSVIQYLLDLTTTTQSRLPRAQEDVALFRTLKVSEEARLSGVVRRYLAMDTAPPGASGTGGANASADQSRGPATEDPVDTDREQSGSTPNQDAGGTVEDEERYLEDKKHHVAGVRANLRGLGGYLGYLIWGSQEFAASASTDHTTYSTPAIAKRKRGRPSKASQQAKQSHSMLYPSAPSTSSRLAPPARTASPHAASASTSASPATPAGAGAGATSTTATASTGSGSGRGRGTATARPAARLKKNMVQYARVPAGAAAAAAAARSAPPSSRAGRVDDGAVSPVMAHSAPQGHSVSGHATGAGAGADGGVQESMDDQEQASEIVKHLRATLAGGHAPSTATGDVGEEAESPNAGGRSSEGGAADGATPPARAVADLGRSSSSDIRQGQAEAANTDNPNTDPVLAQLERSGEAFASLLRAQMAEEDDPAASPSSHSQQEQAGTVESRVEVDGHGYEQEQYEHENEGEGQGDEEEEYDADGTLRPAQGGSGSGSGHIAVNGVDPLDPTVLEQLGKGPPGSCEVCSRTQSTVWRKLTVGEEDYRVCNACGLYHKKFGVVRPAALWGDGESVRKRRPARGPDEDRRRVKRSKQYMGDEGVGTGFRSNGMGLPNHYTAGPGNNMSISSLSHHVEREYAVQAGHLQGHGNRGGAAGEGAWGEDEEAGEAGAGEGGDAQKARPRGKTSRYAPTESLLKASGVTAAQEQARLLQAVRTAASAAGGLPMEEFDPSALFDKGDDPAPVSVSASGDVADGEGADAAEGGAGNKEKVIRGHYHRAPVSRPGAAPGGDEEEEEEVEEVEEQRVQYDLQHHRFDPQHHYIREAQRAVEAAQRQQYLEEQEQIRSAAQAGAQIVYGEEQEQYYDPATHGQYDPAQQYDTTVQMDPHGHLQSHGQEDSGMQVGQYGYVHPDPDLGQSGYSHDPHSLPHEFQHQHQQQHHDHQQTHQPQLQHQHDQQPVRYTDPGMDLAQQALDAGIHLPDGVDLGDVAGVPDLMEVFGHLQ